MVDQSFDLSKLMCQHAEDIVEAQQAHQPIVIVDHRQAAKAPARILQEGVFKSTSLPTVSGQGVMTSLTGVLTGSRGDEPNTDIAVRDDSDRRTLIVNHHQCTHLTAIHSAGSGLNGLFRHDDINLTSAEAGGGKGPSFIIPESGCLSRSATGQIAKAVRSLLGGRDSLIAAFRCSCRNRQAATTLTAMPMPLLSRRINRRRRGYLSTSTHPILAAHPEVAQIGHERDSSR